MSSGEFLHLVEEQVPELGGVHREGVTPRDRVWGLVPELCRVLEAAYADGDVDLADRVLEVAERGRSDGDWSVGKAFLIVWSEHLAWYEPGLVERIDTGPPALRAEGIRVRDHLGEQEARRRTPEQLTTRIIEIFAEVRALELGRDREAVVAALRERLGADGDLLVGGTWVQDEVGRMTQRGWRLRHPMRHHRRRRRQTFLHPG